MTTYRVPAGKWAGFLLTEIPDASLAALVSGFNEQERFDDAARCKAEMNRRRELGIWTGRSEGAVPKKPVPASESLFGNLDETC